MTISYSDYCLNIVYGDFAFHTSIVSRVDYREFPAGSGLIAHIPAGKILISTNKFQNNLNVRHVDYSDNTISLSEYSFERRYLIEIEHFLAE